MAEVNKDRENCFWLNQSVRDVMKVLAIFSAGSYDDMPLDEIVRRTGLGEDHCREILYTLAFDSFLIETTRGFNANGSIKLEQLTERSAAFLAGIWGDRYSEPLVYRLPVGEWAVPIARRL